MNERDYLLVVRLSIKERMSQVAMYILTVYGGNVGVEAVFLSGLVQITCTKGHLKPQFFLVQGVGGGAQKNKCFVL